MSSQFYSAGSYYRDMQMLPNMDTYIDPNFETTVNHSFPEPWSPCLNNNNPTIFNTIPSRLTETATPVQYPRHTSPMSFHSLRADTESSYDHPSTPPDTMNSPYLQSLGMESLPVPHGAHEFNHMGQGTGMGEFVSLTEVNPAQQHHDYADSEHSFNDFKLFYPSNQYDFDINNTTTSLPTNSLRLPSPEDIPIIKQEIDVAPPPSTTINSYPPPPQTKRSPSISSEEDAISLAPSTRRTRDSFSPSDDEDYQPPKPKRTRPSTTTTRNPSFSINLPSSSSSPPRGKRTSSTTIPRSLPYLCPHPSCLSTSKPPFPSQGDLDLHTKKQHTRPFICVFEFAGCASTFASKNEWKRHVTTQHLLLTYWLCTEDSCATAKQPSIFNRKDLFTQHLKRMHCPSHLKKQVMAGGKQNQQTNGNKEWEEKLRTMQARGIRERCKLPMEMKCPVKGCEKGRFEGKDAWDMRMEHVAKHLERERVEQGDESLVGWAGREEVGIIVRSGNGWELKKKMGGHGCAVGKGLGSLMGMGGIIVRGQQPQVVVKEEIVVNGEEEDAEGEDD
ncbi:hypothetical protein QBC38DRAFT_250534 [Podospora fimiseda]|uniref:C2H2-type domain-containing protein n=1 Tax=Podospora fimiseda TaxID=252190 RepID=A0AAN7BM90_9PEZI|nr:hypothetical protein QBC38DRAFT_250534 [Podospora fimiseda]